MPDERNRTTESEIAEGVLTILSLRQSGKGYFEDLFRTLPKVLDLTDEVSLNLKAGRLKPCGNNASGTLRRIRVLKGTISLKAISLISTGA